MTKEEFSSVLLPHKNSMFRMAYCLLKNTEEAEDAVQEAFVKVWNKQMKIGEIKNPLSFLISVTRNHCLDKIKRVKQPRLTLNEDVVANYNEIPDMEMEQNQLVTVVMKLIKTLPEQQKTLIQLRDVEGFPLEEIVKITGWEMNYVRVNLSRGRKKIRETLLKLQHYETARA